VIERRSADRRTPHGDVLLARVRDARGGTVSFVDLARAVGGRGVRISQVAQWIVRAQAAGVIEDAGFATDDAGRPMGPRLYRMGERGQTIVAGDRRRGDRRERG
jgi:hypothetical protein